MLGDLFIYDTYIYMIHIYIYIQTIFFLDFSEWGCVD